MSRNSKRFRVKTAIALLAAVAAEPLFAQSGLEKFATSNEDNPQTINYGPIDEFIDAVSVKRGDRRNFRYSVLSDQGKPALDAYISSLTGITPTALSKREQLTYWLNLHNLLVLRAVASEGGKRSLKRPRGEFDDPGELWTRKLVSVEGAPVSLDDIERRIVLANWSSEPNVMYGLYQGIEGGPAFEPPKTFSSETLDADLKSRGVAFVNERRSVRVRRDSARVPAIYEWYKASLFGGDDAQVLDHVKSLATDDLADDLSGATKVSYNKMDFGVEEEVVRQQRIDTGAIGGGGGGGGS
ncbi:MAG: DUF547 domain-containing protein [Parvularculaceae bacterium]